VKKKEKEKKEKKNWAHEGPRKKEEEQKIAHVQRKWREVVHEKESIHHPQKQYIPTHAHLDQGL